MCRWAAGLINLLGRVSDSLPAKYLAITLALAVSLLAAWLMWRLVETRAQSWSLALRYSKSPRRAADNPAPPIQNPEPPVGSAAPGK